MLILLEYASQQWCISLDHFSNSHLQGSSTATGRLLLRTRRLFVMNSMFVHISKKTLRRVAIKAYKFNILRNITCPGYTYINSPPPLRYLCLTNSMQRVWQNNLLALYRSQHKLFCFCCYNMAINFETTSYSILIPGTVSISLSF